jgi:hypothetical protein
MIEALMARKQYFTQRYSFLSWTMLFSTFAPGLSQKLHVSVTRGITREGIRLPFFFVL